MEGERAFYVICKSKERGTRGNQEEKECVLVTFA